MGNEERVLGLSYEMTWEALITSRLDRYPAMENVTSEGSPHEILPLGLSASMIHLEPHFASIS